MNLKYKLYIILAISFCLLAYSFYSGKKNVETASAMIKHIEKVQLRFLEISYKLAHEIEINQSNILQALLLKDINSTKSINESFDKLNILINQLDLFTKKNNLHIDDIEKIIYTIKRRMVGYKAVEDSLIKSLNSNNKEDIEDAIIGFEAITVKFSDELNKLVFLSNNILKNNIKLLKQNNKQSQIIINLALIFAIALIILAVNRLVSLYHNLNRQLLRTERAEKKQKKLQAQLSKYNDNLEAEVALKSKELYKKIYSNTLSNLPNRNKLLDDIEQYNFAQMAILNIDKFQMFNDVYGEDMGNIALKMTADFLKNQINSKNISLYHLNGDEFVFVVQKTNSLNKKYFAQEIKDILKNFSKKTFYYDDKKFNFIMSAGLAYSGEKKILAYADMALKDAKKRNIQLSIFDDEKELEKIHKHNIECYKKLLYALENNKVLSFFQPIVSIQDLSKPTKYESLVRIEQEDGKIISPINFIDVAKTNRIYDRLTKQIIKNTLDTIEKYKINCSINISIKDLENEKTLGMLYERFNTFQHNNLLTIELLETEEFKDYKSVYEFCKVVRSHGIKIALDDFGAGYSNFSHILNLEVDYIKIDASLISNIETNENSKIMVETIVALARRLEVETIAEFVSSKAILEIVRDLKVDYAQGYYVGVPQKIQKHLPITSPKNLLTTQA